MAFSWDWGQQEGKKKKKSEVATCSNNFFICPVFNSSLHLVERGKLVPVSPLYLLLLYPFSHGAEALLVMDSCIILFVLYSSLMACVCLEEHHGFISYSFLWKSSIFSFRKTICFLSHIVKYKGSTLYNFFSKIRKIISQTCFRCQHDSFVTLLQQIFQSLLVVSRKNEVGFLEQKIHLILADCCK